MRTGITPDADVKTKILLARSIQGFNEAGPVRTGTLARDASHEALLRASMRPARCGPELGCRSGSIHSPIWPQ